MHHLAQMSSVTLALNMKTASYLPPNLGHVTCHRSTAFILFLFLQLWPDRSNSIHQCCNWGRRTSVSLSYMMAVSSSIICRLRRLTVKMASEPVIANKLTSQAVVSFGHIGKTSHKSSKLLHQATLWVLKNRLLKFWHFRPTLLSFLTCRHVHTITYI